MKSDSIKSYIRAYVVAVCSFMVTIATAEPLKLKVDVTNGRRAITMNNYLTATLAVNLQPSQSIASADVTITNPVTINGQANTTNAENILISGIAPQTHGNFVIGDLDAQTWPQGGTRVIYKPSPYNPPPNACQQTPVLAPGESCYIRFESEPWSAHGSQFLQIKGDNTQTIGVLLTVS